MSLGVRRGRKEDLGAQDKDLFPPPFRSLLSRLARLGRWWRGRSSSTFNRPRGVVRPGATYSIEGGLWLPKPIADVWTWGGQTSRHADLASGAVALRFCHSVSFALAFPSTHQQSAPPSPSSSPSRRSPARPSQLRAELAMDATSSLPPLASQHFTDAVVGTVIVGECLLLCRRQWGGVWGPDG